MDDRNTKTVETHRQSGMRPKARPHTAYCSLVSNAPTTTGIGHVESTLSPRGNQEVKMNGMLSEKPNVRQNQKEKKNRSGKGVERTDD